MPAKLKAKPGDVYSELTLIRRERNTRTGNMEWLCACSCGRECFATGGHLTQGMMKSCGKCNIAIRKVDDATYEYTTTDLRKFIFDSDLYDLVSSHKWFIGGNLVTLKRQ